MCYKANKRSLVGKNHTDIKMKNIYSCFHSTHICWAATMCQTLYWVLQDISFLSRSFPYSQTARMTNKQIIMMKCGLLYEKYAPCTYYVSPEQIRGRSGSFLKDVLGKAKNCKMRKPDRQGEWCWSNVATTHHFPKGKTALEEWLITQFGREMYGTTGIWDNEAGERSWIQGFQFIMLSRLDIQLSYGAASVLWLGLACCQSEVSEVEVLWILFQISSSSFYHWFHHPL